MKKLRPPKVMDSVILKKIKKGRWSASNYIDENLTSMRLDYLQFKKNKGSAFFVNESQMSDKLKTKIIYHFENPRSELSYIKIIRDNLSPNCCPTCGGMGTSSVDHYLPKAAYPNLALFSWNLVPACDCNYKRTATVKGINLNQIPIHPYFDDGLHERLMKAEFSGDFDNDEISVHIVPLPCNNIHIDKIIFHIEHVINRTRIKTWMIDRWSTLIRNTSTIVTSIPNRHQLLSQASLINYIDSTIEAHDDEHQTPNNWKSMFLYGIRDSPAVIDWLVDNHNSRAMLLRSSLELEQ